MFLFLLFYHYGILSISGECWTGSDKTNYGKQAVAKCLGFGYKPCKSTDFYCVGKEHHNFVYKLVEEL